MFDPRLEPAQISGIDDFNITSHRLIALWAKVWEVDPEEVERRIGIHPEQLEAFQHLYKKKDVILVAKRGFGKSLIFQSMPLLREGGIALLVYPQAALEKAQHMDISTLPGVKSFILNGRTNTIENLRRVASGEFTHILTSPEIAVESQRNFVLMS